MSLQQKGKLLHSRKIRSEEQAEENQATPFLQNQLEKYFLNMNDKVDSKDQITLAQFLESNQVQLFKYIIQIRLKNSQLQLQEMKDNYKNFKKQKSELERDYEKLKRVDVSTNEDKTTSQLFEYSRHKIKQKNELERIKQPNKIQEDLQLEALSTNQPETSQGYNRESNYSNKQQKDKSKAKEKKHFTLQQLEQQQNPQVYKQYQQFKFEKISQKQESQEILRTQSVNEVHLQGEFKSFNKKSQKNKKNQEKAKVSEIQNVNREETQSLMRNARQKQQQQNISNQEKTPDKEKESLDKLRKSESLEIFNEQSL